MNTDGSEIQMVYAPVVSSVTGEFTEEFLRFWPFSSPPRILNWTSPYDAHLKTLPVKWILTESDPKGKTPRYIVTAFPYGGYTGIRVYQVKWYREWVKSYGIPYGG